LRLLNHLISLPPRLRDNDNDAFLRRCGCVATPDGGMIRESEISYVGYYTSSVPNKIRVKPGGLRHESVGRGENEGVGDDAGAELPRVRCVGEVLEKVKPVFDMVV